eukprot:Hpha_TRINITY_DN16884_c0_g3::TRINITY_DN16884_c0_g3_i1::g.148383::m.148383
MGLLWLSLLFRLGAYEYVFLHDDAAIQFSDFGMTGLSVVAGTADIAGKTASGGAVLSSDTFGAFYGSCKDYAGKKRYACIPVSPQYAGLKFAYAPRRGDLTIFYVTAAAGTADYTIDEYNGNTWLATLGTFSVTRGSIQRHDYDVRGKMVVFTATSGTIYVAQNAADIGGKPGTNGDYFVLAPVSEQIYGSVCVEANILALGMQSSVTESCDDGGVATLGPDQYIHPADQGIVGWAGKSCSWKADKVGAGIAGGVDKDGGGQDGVSLHPRSLFGYKTFVPSTSILKIISDNPGTCTIGADTVTLAGVAGIYATLSTAPYAAGTPLECTVDVMVIADVSVGMLLGVTADEVNLVMLPMTLAPTTSPSTPPPPPP